MPNSPLSEFIRCLQRLAGAGGADAASDGQLLERFVSRRDESAFETLMARHGPMVLGVCRRVLGDPHDAADAFQAVFLVLAHKADSIGRPQALGSWLYRIAQRTAVRAKVQRNRRRARESILDDLPAPETVEELAWHELRPVLDEEVNRLPQKYRDVVLCCYLQEKTYTEAAKSLGLAAGTVSSRLARARDILRKRLLRRGLALSSSLLGTLLAQQALSAAVPSALRTITIQAALRIAAGQTVLAGLVAEPVAVLTKEVLKAMFMTKLRMTGLVLLVLGVLGAGAGVVSYGALAEKRLDAPKAETPPAEPRPPDKVVASSGADEKAPAGGKAVDGLRIRLQLPSAEKGKDPPTLCKVVFENVGDSDLTVKLGISLANGKSYHPSALRLIGRSMGEKPRTFRYSIPAVAGRVDPFIVPLPAGSTYTLRIPFEKFSDSETGERIDLTAKGYRIAAELHGEAVTKPNGDVQGLVLISYWVGKARSNEVQVSSVKKGADK